MATGELEMLINDPRFSLICLVVEKSTCYFVGAFLCNKSCSLLLIKVSTLQYRKTNNLGKQHDKGHCL